MPLHAPIFMRAAKAMSGEAVSALPEPYRLPVYLYYYEGYATAEISKMLRVNHATLRTRLRVARIKLKLLLKEDIDND